MYVNYLKIQNKPTIIENSNRWIFHNQQTWTYPSEHEDAPQMCQNSAWTAAGGDGFLTELGHVCCKCCGQTPVWRAFFSNELIVPMVTILMFISSIVQWN